MDPNVALAYLERHPATSADDAELGTLDHACALYDWLRCGGFAPDWQKYPHGTRTYRTLSRDLSRGI